MSTETTGILRRLKEVGYGWGFVYYVSYIENGSLLNQAFSLFDIIVIIGIVQGLVTSTLLILRKKHRSDTYLALAIIAFCLLSSKILIHTLGLWNTHTFRYFPLGVDLAIPPLIYFYVILLIEPKIKAIGWKLLHFVPFVLSEIYSLVVYIKVLSTTESGVKDAIAKQFHFDQVKFIEDYLTLVSVFTYLIVGLFILKRYRQRLISDSSHPTFNWLRNILLQLLVIGILLLINLSLDRFFSFGSSNFFRWQLFYGVVAVHIYFLGFAGYKRVDYPTQNIAKRSTKSKLISQKQVEAIKRKVEQALKEGQAYLDPQLSASKLAKNINTSQSDLSYAINFGFQKNFRELVNEYRVKEAKAKLIDPSCSHLSIVGIAYEAGFNSEASFYRIFKRATGTSPAEYQREHVE